MPALRIRDEVVLESLDILQRIDLEFPPVSGGTQIEATSEWAHAVVGRSSAFDTDCDAWLHNVDAKKEDVLFAQARDKLAWLEEALGVHPGVCVCVCVCVCILRKRVCMLSTRRDSPCACVCARARACSRVRARERVRVFHVIRV